MAIGPESRRRMNRWKQHN